MEVSLSAILFLAIILKTSAGFPQGQEQHQVRTAIEKTHRISSVFQKPQRYHYYYQVNVPHTKDQKYHYEESEDGVTRGQYAVAEPDGTIRTVRYTSAGTRGGFRSVVTKSGPSVHPEKYYKPKEFYPF